MSETFTVRVQKDGQPVHTVVVGDKDIIIGRSLQSDLCIEDKWVSRQHARLRISEGKLLIEDLDSRNGFKVNGLRTASSVLTPEDVVSLGAYTLIVEQEDEFAALEDLETQIPFDSVSEISSRVASGRLTSPLQLLYQASQLLLNYDPTPQTLEQVLELVMEELPAQRIFIVQARGVDSATNVAHSRLAPGSNAQSPLSQTMIHYVLATRSAVLTSSGSSDPRFNRAKSIFLHGVKSVMCVPLHGRHRMFGVAYIDSDKDSAAFTMRDLETLTVLGQMVGVALENQTLMEERLRQERLAAIGQAVATTSHHLKNILTGVCASLELMQEAYSRENWKSVGTGLAVMQRSIDRFRRAVQNMLVFSKDATVMRSPASLNQCVEDAVHAQRARAEQQQVALLWTPGIIGGVSMDAEQMYEVVLNLVGNAIEACEQGGIVTVLTEQNRAESRIIVRDTGQGIPAEHLARLREPFFTTKGSTGTGLGLAVSWRIVEAHGGTIEVESTPGAGATFTVVIPNDLDMTLLRRPIS